MCKLTLFVCRSIDPSAALSLPGVQAFYSAKDLDPSRNNGMPFLPGEEVFASQSVVFMGNHFFSCVSMFLTPFRTNCGCRRCRFAEIGRRSCKIGRCKLHQHSTSSSDHRCEHLFSI